MISAYEGMEWVPCTPLRATHPMRLGARQAIQAKCKARTGNGGWRGGAWAPWTVCCALRAENRRVKREQDQEADRRAAESARAACPIRGVPS